MGQEPHPSSSPSLNVHDPLQSHFTGMNSMLPPPLSQISIFKIVLGVRDFISFIQDKEYENANFFVALNSIYH